MTCYQARKQSPDQTYFSYFPFILQVCVSFIRVERLDFHDKIGSLLSPILYEPRAAVIFCLMLER